MILYDDPAAMILAHDAAEATKQNFAPKSCKRLFCRRYKAASAQLYTIQQALDNAVDSVKEALPKGSTF